MNELLAELLVPFAYQYMLKAMWVSALVGGVCAFLSAYLMLKGWSLMGDALAHSIVPGVAGAYILGFPFAIGAFFSGILAAFGMQFVKQHTRLREDAVIGLVFTSLFALGLLMASIWPTSVSIQTIVLGNILAISDEDVVQVAIISAVSLSILVLKWKDLMVTFFDESHARSLGLNTTLLKVMFFALLSACTVAALQTVGACLVIAMVVTPGATAYLLTDRFGRLIVISVAIGVATSFVGAYISYFIDGATGGVIVTLQTLLFIAAFFLAPKHGVAGGPAQDRRRGSRRMTPLEWITVPLQYPFMQRALVVSVIVGAVCAVLSCYLVLKGWSLMGDAISHAVLPGIVLAFILGLPLALGAFAAGLSCALLTGYLKENSRVKEDTVMGIVFSGMFGLGLVIFSKIETELHLLHILFGNVLGVTAQDVARDRVHRGWHASRRTGEAPRPPALLFRSEPCARRGPAGACAALRPVDPPLADDRGVAQGGRHHPCDRHAGRAWRDRLPADRQLRAHAGDRDRRCNHVVCARHHRELPHRRRDRRLHRADSVRDFRAGVPVRAEARAGGELGTCGAINCALRLAFTRY